MGTKIGGNCNNVFPTATSPFRKPASRFLHVISYHSNAMVMAAYSPVVGGQKSIRSMESVLQHGCHYHGIGIEKMHAKAWSSWVWIRGRVTKSFTYSKLSLESRCLLSWCSSAQLANGDPHVGSSYLCLPTRDQLVQCVVYEDVLGL